ncbi:MAG: type I restriction endonuclease subunit R [Crocinitomicaceae bacterium]|nr:type I restriction endonuclease subunit R [Crocinitomicaceae bacterium]
MKFNEDSRVKIPAILHLMQLGYEYLSLKTAKWDEETNIFSDVFKEKLLEINEGFGEDDYKRVYDDISIALENEDLGKQFYEMLTSRSGTRLIDFENFENNSFHVVTELTYRNGDDEFRPDIIILINGLPLVFIEVKKPNNLDGTLAEKNRMHTRFQNKKFRKFINLTQFMLFSNNMEYDDESTETLQGAFYASTSYHKAIFNYFREDPDFTYSPALKVISDEEENFVLKDNNLASIKQSQEFLTNKNPNSPTQRICTSLLSKERLAFMLRYSIAFVQEEKGLEKHIMRYPQLFATQAIKRKLEEGEDRGIIWHTQGSGKTALTYYNVHHLTDYYQSKNVIPKFYFIVDRLDLLTQAKREFSARGLKVHVINSRDEFAKDIKNVSAIHNDAGAREITVVNIQKFKDDPDVLQQQDYNLHIQRVYFLDEVHRSYNPKGSFLANLEQSDKNAIKIGLTGTPLIGSNYKSKDLFGNYIHKYYYNSSIKDGYTLRLIREDIETSYKMQMEQALEDINILKGDGDKRFVFAHEKYCAPLLDYIVTDFENSRMRFNDNSIGGMVVCDSSDQAKELMRIFEDKYAEKEETLALAAEQQERYGNSSASERKVKSAALILHDVGDKQTRKEQVEAFKDGKIDLLFVYNMLLTGFDAKRLKKLYIGRVIKSHNLLQTLTRVNRTYKDFKYGYVVDFADIKQEFKKTNEAYFNELQNELGDELKYYSDLFKSPEEIDKEIVEIKDTLLYFDTKNREVFSQQISEINDRETILKIAKALNQAKSLYNLIRLSGNFDLLEKLDFRQLNSLATMAQQRLSLINTKEKLEKSVDTSNLLNTALEDVVFAFAKLSEEEMRLADELKDVLKRTREHLSGTLDPKDPQWISLKEELERLFKKKNLTDVSKTEMAENIEALNEIFELSKRNDRHNRLIAAKYENDNKYMRVHKRLSEKDPITEKESKLFEALQDLKHTADEQILRNSHQLDNEAYISRMMGRLILEKLMDKHQIQLDANTTKRINMLLVNEYINEYLGRPA